MNGLASNNDLFLDTDITILVKKRPKLSKFVSTRNNTTQKIAHSPPTAQIIQPAPHNRHRHFLGIDMAVGATGDLTPPAGDPCNRRLMIRPFALLATQPCH